MDNVESPYYKMIKSLLYTTRINLIILNGKWDGKQCKIQMQGQKDKLLRSLSNSNPNFTQN
jgi:hypothetical protein